MDAIPKYPEQRVDFSKSVFDAQIQRNSYLIQLETAVFCPCKNIDTNYIDPYCPYCKGSGWIYSKPIDVQGMITSLNYQQSLQMNYVEINATANLTLSDQYDFRLHYFDKLTIKDGEGIIKNSNIRFDFYENNQRERILQAYIPFQINKVDSLAILLPDGIRTLVNSVDYVFNGNVVTLSQMIRIDVEKQGVNILQGSIRYYHRPIYRVLQNTHVIRMSRINESGVITPNLLPLQYLIREQTFFTEQGDPV